MRAQFPHFPNLNVVVGIQLQASYCKVNVTGIDGQRTCLGTVLLDSDRYGWSVDSLLAVKLLLKDLLHNGLDVYDNRLALLSDRVELPFKVLDALFDLCTYHLMELVVLLCLFSSG